MDMFDGKIRSDRKNIVTNQIYGMSLTPKGILR